MAAISPFDAPALEAICNVLGDTTSGLSNSEISRHLAQLGYLDPETTASKRVRLREALSLRQRSDRCGNPVIAFIESAMNPVLYHANPTHFEDKRSELNIVLALRGYTLRQDGHVAQVETASTLDEAERRASRLQAKLRDRGVHLDVLKFCRAELVEDDYFHAVLEAVKSVSEKIRELSGLTSDGAELFDQAFAGATPMLALNSLRTDTEWAEQRGFVNLLKGTFGTFRTVTGHAPRIYWPMKEEDALDLLSLASYLHRRLDSAVPTGWRGNP